MSSLLDLVAAEASSDRWLQLARAWYELVSETASYLTVPSSWVAWVALLYAVLLPVAVLFVLALAVFWSRVALLQRAWPGVELPPADDSSSTS